MKKIKSTYTCAIGILENNKLSDIKVCQGFKKDIINFLNEEIGNKNIKYFFKKEIVINLTYSNDSINNLDEWFTLEELKDIGVFIRNE